MKIINLVSAHTGNDAINHGMAFADWIIGLFMLVALVFAISLLIKKYKKIK